MSELLLTSLKGMVPEGSQKILISAVISNASAVGTWLNGEDSEIVSGMNLIPTYRSIAFASWRDLHGRLLNTGWLRFLNPNNSDEYEFFVPRVIERYKLKNRKDQFPTQKINDRGKEIAIFLGLKLVHNGSVALFCGRKTTASGLCEKAVKAFKGDLPVLKPIQSSNAKEVHSLTLLITNNYGPDAIITKSAELGIFAHHGNTPHGIRLALEYAMQQSLVKFIICTSTLAQGVNLPIRYLILTSVYQGTERIKVRDFHNLIGRAGRSGMHTEGSIIFADPIIYDGRNTRTDLWRWRQVKELINPDLAEPCASTLLSIFDPLQSDDKKQTIDMQPLDFIKEYTESPENIASFPSIIFEKHSDKGFTLSGIAYQISWKMNIISSVENFLMSHLEESNALVDEEAVFKLASDTLAYFLSNEEQKMQIVEMFKLLATNISSKIVDESHKNIYSKTLLGLTKSLEIESWVTKNSEILLRCETSEEFLFLIWPLIASNITNNSFSKCDKPEILKELAIQWIAGEPFYRLLNILSNSNTKLIAGKQRRNYKLDHIVDICENGYAYEGTLIVGAITQLITLLIPDVNIDFIHKLNEFQKKLKYGLPNMLSISFYELGFADRYLSLKLSSLFSLRSLDKRITSKSINENEKAIREILESYPSYFKMIMDTIGP